MINPCLFVSALFFAFCIFMGVHDYRSIDRDQQFIELMHQAERSNAIDFRLHRLDLELLRD